MVWSLFLLFRAPIPRATFEEYDRARAARIAEARRTDGMVMSIVSDRPLVIAQRPISSWGDGLMHIVLLLNFPATVCATIVSIALDESGRIPSLVETYVVAAVLITISTLQWFVVGRVVHRTALRGHQRDPYV